MDELNLDCFIQRALDLLHRFRRRRPPKVFNQPFEVVFDLGVVFGPFSILDHFFLGALYNWHISGILAQSIINPQGSG